MSSRKRRRWQFIRQKFPKRMQKKLVILFIAIILAFVFLIGKITYINATNGEKYTKIVLNQQQYNSRTIMFKRGDIVDRNGNVLATSERVYNVILDVYAMAGDEDLDEEEKTERINTTKLALSEFFGIDPSVVDDKIENKISSRYEIMKKKVSYEEAQAYLEEYEDLSTVWLEENYKRTYPYSTLACDVIGFTNSANVGMSGIESYYNDVLNGTDGREYGYLDSDAALERTVKEAINGYTVVSTIDLSLQSIVEKHVIAFNEAHKNEARDGEGSLNTAVIVADPNTCEILAEVTYPNFDLNDSDDLSQYYTDAELSAMEEEEISAILIDLWSNFCVSSRYEPGSTVKPFTEVAGLETGVLSGSETFNCTGSLKIAGQTNVSCHDTSGHGIQTLSDGIANSCNVVMMYIAEELGYEEFLRYQEIFGFGQKTGIDLPNESAGLVQDIESIGPVDLATNSFGQNFEVTMTQMIAAYCSLINGGNYYQPHVVKQIQDENGNVIENIEPVLVKRTVSEETSELLKQYMKLTMTDGTGKNAQVEGYSIGAKTGTAEKYPRGAGTYVLSYMGFAPAEDPEVLVYVVIDEPNVAAQDTSKYVTDLAREIMEEIFPYLDITKEAVTTDDLTATE